LEGVRPVEPLTDSIGILARSITDIELVAKTLGVFRNQIPDLTYTTLKQCRFGFFTGELDHLASEGVKLVWEKAKLALSNASAVVKDVDFGEEFKGWEGVDGKLGRIMNSAADISTFKDYMVNRGQLPESILQAAETGVPRQETVKMYDQLAALRPRFDELADNTTPSSPYQLLLNHPKCQRTMYRTLAHYGPVFMPPLFVYPVSQASTACRSVLPWLPQGM
jgi:Asp-tRNA(Asn)/Glu-tRNA(Gln) amidotransferase A subunit family amidase